MILPYAASPHCPIFSESHFLRKGLHRSAVSQDLSTRCEADGQDWIFNSPFRRDPPQSGAQLVNYYLVNVCMSVQAGIS